MDGSAKRFRVRTDSLREFIAFRDADYLTPTAIGRVLNQDLHATPLPMDLVIVCPPEFQGAAARLAERRMSEGLSVIIVTPQQVYNEFSSGARDATAIKRYMRMLYDKAGTDTAAVAALPLALRRWFVQQHFVSRRPTRTSSLPTRPRMRWIRRRSYTSDDYFGLLDEQDGEGTGDLMDIGVGRFPVSSVQQANEVVDKILSYDQLEHANVHRRRSVRRPVMVAWRIGAPMCCSHRTTRKVIAMKGVIHMSQSDEMARRVEAEHPQFNVDKIYLDAYQQISTPGGERYPAGRCRPAREGGERIVAGELRGPRRRGGLGP